VASPCQPARSRSAEMFLARATSPSRPAPTRRSTWPVVLPVSSRARPARRGLLTLRPAEPPEPAGMAFKASVLVKTSRW